MLCFFSFLQNSNGEDLTNAIKDIETAINLIEEQSDPDPGLATLCYCCGCAMQIKFLFTSKDLTDLEDMIRYFRRALDLNGPDSDSGPDKFPNACRYHSDLAAALHTRFKCLGHVKDIDDAITHFSTALNLTHMSNPTIVPTINSDLGAAYQSRFERLGEHEDLDKAIEVLRLSVERQSNEDNMLPGRLNNLGLSLQHKFELAGDGSVLNEGIACFRQAVELTSMSRHELLSSLGTAYRIAAENEVLSVPHVFRAESVGTARIPIGIRAEILEHSTTQIVGNLSNLSDRIPIGKVNSDRTTQTYFRPVSTRNQSVGSEQFRSEIRVINH